MTRSAELTASARSLPAVTSVITDCVLANMIMVDFVAAQIRSASRRVNRSVPPPGGNGKKRCSGFAGQVCAGTAVQTHSAAAASAALAISFATDLMFRAPPAVTKILRPAQRRT